MSDYVSPGKAALRSLSIKGVNLLQYTNSVKVFESICKPYLTAQVVIIDNNNLMDNMDIVGGEQCNIAFHSPPNEYVYNCTLQILNLKGRPNPNNLKSVIYTIDLIGPTYFQDKANLVQSGHKGQTGTDAIQQIWGQYLGKEPLSILMGSIGMLGDKEGYTVNSMKPLAAIDDIMKTLLFGGSKTGNVMLFRDRDGVKLAPLEFLFMGMGSQETFIQKETWGANFFDPMIYNAIISAQALTDRNNGGRSSVGEIAGAVKQSKMVFDMFEGKIATYLNAAQQVASGNFGGSVPISSMMQSISQGALGGAPNIQSTNSSLWPRATAPDNKTMEERLFSAQSRGGPQIQIKVAMQTGLNVTVGKGATIRLMPPSGDYQYNIFSYDSGGQYLVTDLVHELTADDSQFNGFTTIQGIKGGMTP